MKVIRNNKFVKIIPKKFEPVVDGFNFLSESKRLQPKERHLLILRLIKYHFENSNPTRAQDIFAQECVADAEDIKILKVKRKGLSTDWRIIVDSFQIRVPDSLVGDCPEKFMEVKYEF